MRGGNFFAELKRRNVYRAAVAYGVVAWFLTQLTTQVFPFFDIPNSAIRLVVVALALGFPIAMSLAWVYEFTPEGIVRAEDLNPAKARSARRLTGRVLDFFIMGVLLLVIALLLYQRFPFRTETHETVPQKSIAILPFVDLSQAKDQEYFCDGMSEEILDALAKVKELRVVAHTSSFAFKGKDVTVGEIAQKLNVRNVLEGSLRRDGNRIRISAQLIDARNGFHIWSETYERELQDIFIMQDEITRAIVSALKIKLAVALPVSRKPNPEAHDLDLRGRYFLNHRDLNKAIDYYQQALAKDAKDALAYSGLSEVYLVLAVRADSAPREVMPKAKEAALQALAIDDALGDAHASLAQVTFFYDWDWPAAEREFKRAIELNPNNADAHHWYSHFLISQGRFNESLDQTDRALELNPLDFLMNIHLTWHYLYARQYDKALEQSRKAAEIDKRSEGAWLGEILEQQGKYAEAIARFQKNLERTQAVSTGKANLAHAYAVSGNREAAQKIVSELEQDSKTKYVSPFEIAFVHAGLGEKDQAFEWLEKGYEVRASEMVTLTTEPRLDNLHSDPRFTDLARRMKLNPPK